MRVPITLLLLFLACDVSWSQARIPVPVPAGQTIAEGIISRRSTNKDKHGISQPPWEEISIANIFGFKKRPVIGDTVTVITLDSDISPFTLRILKAKQTENPCTERPAAQWEIELEPLKERKFFDAASPSNRNAEFPFDVVIIYPAVTTGQQIKRSKLKQEMLPKGAFIDTVKAAIDLNDDSKPDVVVLEYCCLDKRIPPASCEYTCGKTYRKVRNSWNLIDTFAPC